MTKLVIWDHQIPSDLSTEINTKQVVSFEQAWEDMKAKGYDYGEDALTNVRFGWDLAQKYINEK